VAIAAVGGIMFSARRRTHDEQWARDVSTTCDTGRALAASVAEHLAEAPTWHPPERIGHQRERFTSSLAHAIRTAPNPELAALTNAVSERNDALGLALDALPIGAPIDLARHALGPALNDLAAALTPLEHEAAAVVYGASFPSTRTTG